MASAVEFKRCETPEDFATLRELCWEYRDFLIGLGGPSARAVSHAYPEAGYAALMDRLPEEHAAPGGGTRLALLNGEVVACGMFRPIAPRTAEIKRVYVRDSARGHGVGRAMMERLIEDCQNAGHQRILMDTGKILKAAVSLYLSMGFALRGPYSDIPEDVAELLVFFEKEI